MVCRAGKPCEHSHGSTKRGEHSCHGTGNVKYESVCSVIKQLAAGWKSTSLAVSPTRHSEVADSITSRPTTQSRCHSHGVQWTTSLYPRPPIRTTTLVLLLPGQRAAGQSPTYPSRSQPGCCWQGAQPSAERQLCCHTCLGLAAAAAAAAAANSCIL